MRDRKAPDPSFGSGADPLTFMMHWRQGLRGAAQLLIGDAKGLDSIPADAAAMRHSFAAAAFCLPLDGFSRWVAWRDQGAPASLWHAVGIDLVLYAIGWAGFLVLCHTLLPVLGQARAWPRLVAVWNWCNVAQYAVLLGAGLFDLFGAGAFVLNVVGLVSLFWASWIEFRALRPVLGGQIAAAAGLVAIDFAIGVVMQVATVSLGG